MIKMEPLNTSKSLLLMSKAAFKPIIHASYIALSLVQENLHNHQEMRAWGDIGTSPISLPWILIAPSKYMLQLGCSSSNSMLIMDSLGKKSTLFHTPRQDFLLNGLRLRVPF